MERTITDCIRMHLLEGVEVAVTTKHPPLAELKQTEWNEEFEVRMRNRMIVGSFRYGRLNDTTRKDFNIDHSSIMQALLQKYAETGNKELLVDVANMAMIEYVGNAHPNAHFNALDDVHVV